MSSFDKSPTRKKTNMRAKATTKKMTTMRMKTTLGGVNVH